MRYFGQCSRFFQFSVDAPYIWRSFYRAVIQRLPSNILHSSQMTDAAVKGHVIRSYLVDRSWRSRSRPSLRRRYRLLTQAHVVKLLQGGTWFAVLLLDGSLYLQSMDSFLDKVWLRSSMHDGDPRLVHVLPGNSGEFEMLAVYRHKWVLSSGVLIFVDVLGPGSRLGSRLILSSSSNCMKFPLADMVRS